MKLRDLDVALRNGGIGMWADGGWRERGGELSGLKAIIAHHTAGGGPNDWKIVRDGRAGLPGPLSHLTLERDGGVRLLASGRCNHAGTGSHPRIGTNNANAWTIGIEGVSRGVGNDWTAAQRREYPRVCAALCRHYRLPAEAVIFHRTWTNRKIDPQGFDLDDFQAEVRRHLSGGAPAPAPSGPPADGHHTVVSGDTLWALSQRYDATVDALRAWNPWIRADILGIGQRVRVTPLAAPAPAPVAPRPAGPGEHVVVAGDTLWAIARRHGVTVDAIKGANALGTDALSIGQRLRIPPPTPEAPPAAPAPAPPPAGSPTTPPIDANLAGLLRAGGIVADPGQVVASARAAGLELAVQCAKLVRESYGGRNVFGNDRVDYPTSGPYLADTVEVDRPSVDAYLAWVKASGGKNRNGVGPSQLTWGPLQDLAEERGGLHLPLVTMTIGAELMVEHFRDADGDLRDAGTLYNGGKLYDDPALEERHREYGRWLEEAVGQWRTRLGAHNTTTTGAAGSPSAPTSSPPAAPRPAPGPPWDALIGDPYTTNPDDALTAADTLAWAAAHSAHARAALERVETKLDRLLAADPRQ